MTPTLGDILADATEHLENAKTCLSWADTAVLNPSPLQKSAANLIVASSYVVAAAAVETYFREALHCVFKAIQGTNSNINKTRGSVLTLFFPSDFASLRDVRDHHKIWANRVKIFEALASDQGIQNLEPELPLDGKTIRPAHIETIWAIFGLPEPAIPSALWRAALTDVADGRNDVAHGNIPVEQFARRIVIKDAKRKIDHIQDLLLHVSARFEAYCNGAGHLR